MMSIVEDEKYFKVKFDYDARMIGAIKQIPGIWWDRANKQWMVLKYRRKELDNFKTLFGFIEAPQPDQEPERFSAIPPMPELTVDIPLRLTPRPYQAQGIAYNLAHDNVLNADQPGLGKLQPLYSKIATPDGWKTMGDMKVGTKIFSKNGRETTVTGVFPHGEKDIYRVVFSDGSTTDCGLEHLWSVRDLVGIKKC